MSQAAEGDEFEALLQFLYLCPVGLIQMDGTGAVEMMNPLAVQLLIPLAPGGDVSNFLVLLGDLAPEVPGLVKSFTEDSGHLCTGHRIQIAHQQPGKAEIQLILSSDAAADLSRAGSWRCCPTSPSR